MTPLAPALLALSLAAQAGSPGGADDPPSSPPPQGVEPHARLPAPGAPPLPSDPTPQTRRYQIERIRIVGTSRTRDAEVRRHLLVAEGELLDDERVLLSRLRLLQLGWFSRVETRVERGSERGLVVLVVEVVERNTLIFTDLIFGGTPAEPFYGGLGLSQQNFLGRGFGLSGAFVYGGSPAGRPQDPDRFAARASFFAPNVAAPGVRHGLVLGATVLLVRGEEFTCDDPECSGYKGDYGAAPRLRYRRLMGEGTVGIRPGPFERLAASYRYEAVDAEEIGAPSAVPGMEPAILTGSSRVAALTGTYEMDTRDDFFFPREGMRGVFQVAFGSRLLGGDYEYSRYLLQLETAYSLLGHLRFQGAVGAAQGSAPFFDRFYAADWSYFALGPALGRALELNFSTDSRYDAFLAMGGVEYGAPLWGGSGFFRRGYLAVGARAVHSTATLGGVRTAVSRSPLSAEVALRLDTPVGVFNLSTAYLLDIFL
jgi:outer membrane protein assembly factor BamA